MKFAKWNFAKKKVKKSNYLRINLAEPNWLLAKPMSYVAKLHGPRWLRWPLVVLISLYYIILEKCLHTIHKLSWKNKPSVLIVSPVDKWTTKYYFWVTCSLLNYIILQISQSNVFIKFLHVTVISHCSWTNCACRATR